MNFSRLVAQEIASGSFLPMQRGQLSEFSRLGIRELRMADDAADIKGLTADIVASYVTGNQIPVSELPGLISKVFGALSGAGAAAPIEAAAEGPKKITPGQVRKSITPDGITCFDCGKTFKTLRRHLRAEHGMKPGEYIGAWGLPRDYPMVAETTSALRRSTAVANGLGRKPATPPAKSKPKKRSSKTA